MRKGIARDKLETMIVASGKSGLQAVVGRTVNVREIIDLAEIRERAGKGLRGIRGRTRRSVIEVNDAGKFDGVVADVSNVERQFSRNRVLDAYGPVRNVGRAEIAVHGEGVARTRVGPSTWHIGAVAALNKSGERGAVDGRGLILPVQATRAGACEGQSGGNNVTDGRRGDWSDRAITGHNGHGTSRDGRASGHDADAKENRSALQVLLRQERAHGEDVVNKAAAEANDGGGLAGDIPCNTHPRREVLAVAPVDGTDVFADLFQANGRLKVSEQIV